MKVTDFGATVKGDETKLYTLTNKNGMEIAVSDYGATLVQVIVPDKEGKPCDVVLDMMRQQDMKKEICSSVQLSGEVQTVSEEHPLN